jgi:hypothetical protein
VLWATDVLSGTWVGAVRARLPVETAALEASGIVVWADSASVPEDVAAAGSSGTVASPGTVTANVAED